MLRPTVRSLAIVLPLVAATLAAPSPAAADSIAERAAVSCLTGATISGITTGLATAPLTQTGVGTAVAVSAVIAAAGAGCGVGLAWTATATGYSLMWQSLFPPPDSPIPSRPRLPPEAPTKDLIHAELP